MDPLSVVGAILTVVQLIGSAASTASQNKHKCLELAERAKNLGEILSSLSHGAAKDAAKARVLERLKEAVDEALRVIQACQSGGVFSKYSRSKGAELDGVDKRINNCIMDLTLISQARASHTTTTTSVNMVTAAPVPAQTHVHVDHASYYHQGQGGGASSAHGGWAAPPSPSLQHTYSAPPAPGYCQQPHGYGQWAPPPSPGPYYAAPPAPSGSNLSSYYTLPTVNKVLKRVFR